MFRYLVIAAAVMLAGFSAPPPAPASDLGDMVVFVKPDWARRPSGDDMARLYPEKATRLGLGGRVTLTCVVDVEGLLKDCTVAEETPPDLGFGEAALELSQDFLMKPATRNGVPVENPVRIPLVFSPPVNSPGPSLDLDKLMGGALPWVAGGLALLLLGGVLLILRLVFRVERDRPIDL